MRAIPAPIPGNDAFNDAVARMVADPGAVTDADIDALAAVNADAATDAIDARRRAVLDTLPASVRPVDTKSRAGLIRTRSRCATDAPPATSHRADVMTRDEFTAWEVANTEAVADAIVVFVKAVITPIKAELAATTTALAAEREARDTERRDYDARIKALEGAVALETRLRTLERATGVMAHAPTGDVQ